jgi:pyruvate/oxaloacetate carboxyltransferase
LAGNIAVANQMGMDPAVAMADKDIQKVLTAFNQGGSRENVANINAMAKMYGADRGVDVAKIKAMAQALSTDARLSATERMYYANLANKLDIARMNATVAPYRFGYDISPEYVDLINSGASIQAPIVPSTNVLGGMLGNQGFTNQLDFNRINRGN